MYGYKGLQGFVAELKAPLKASDTTPVLDATKEALINAVLGNGDHTYMTLVMPVGFEIVKVTSAYNTISMERGQDGTVAQPFPIGSCMAFAMVGAAVTDLANQANACPTGCTPASILEGGYAPNGVAGNPYYHRIVISGTPPFALGQVQAPNWMFVTLDAGEIRLSGTPLAPGAYDVSVPLYSCGELKSFFQQCIIITAAEEEVPV